MTPSEARALLNRVVLALDDDTALGLGLAVTAAVERTDGQGHLTLALDAADELVELLEGRRGFVTQRRIDKRVAVYRTVRPR